MTEKFCGVNRASFFVQMSSSEMIRTEQTSFSDALITSETHGSHEWLLTMQGESVVSKQRRNIKSLNAVPSDVFLVLYPLAQITGCSIRRHEYT
jgi:hypothetical protein